MGAACGVLTGKVIASQLQAKSDPDATNLEDHGVRRELYPVSNFGVIMATTFLGRVLIARLEGAL